MSVITPPRLPPAPTAWLTFCTSKELGRSPLSRSLVGRNLMAFRAVSGRVVVMPARCPHMGADLSQGTVVGESIQCPFHHWQFGIDGACTHVPAEPNSVPSASLPAYAALERHGLVFLYHGDSPFELPFFPGKTCQQMSRAPAFQLVLDCPWYMIGANGVDVQHFQTTHDRQLLEPPTIEHPHPLVHRAKTRFAVVGQGVADRLTRTFAGNEVTMDVMDWAGALFFVQATFRRTQTFGMVGLLPLQPAQTMVFVTVFVRRSVGRMGRWLFDPANAAIRRLFVYNFLKPDVLRSAGTDYHPDSLIAADRVMANYFEWLANIHVDRQAGDSTVLPMELTP